MTEPEDGTWAGIIAPLARKLEMAATFNGTASWNAVGSKAFAVVLRQMAEIIDDEIILRRILEDAKKIVIRRRTVLNANQIVRELIDNYEAGYNDESLASLLVAKLEAKPDPKPAGRDDQLAKDRQRILDAMAYRSGNDGVNSRYMGSMAVAGLYHILNLKYGAEGFHAALQAANRETVDKLLAAAASYIDYMEQHPVKRCQCCGQIV